jgi:hypothetical protein
MTSLKKISTLEEFVAYIYIYIHNHHYYTRINMSFTMYQTKNIEYHLKVQFFTTLSMW